MRLREVYKLLRQKEFRIIPRAFSKKFITATISDPKSSFTAKVHLRRGSTDYRVFEQLFIHRQYAMDELAGHETDVRDIYENIGKPLILDLGANTGLSSLYLAKNYPAACILAVEPSQDNFEILVSNTRDHRSIRPIHAAVSNKDGAVQMVNPGMGEWAYQTESVENDQPDAIPAFSVQSLTNTMPECIPFLAKIDIEGFEDVLFSSNTNWIERFPVIIIELHDWMLPGKANSTNFLRAIAQYDRDLLFRGENVVSIANIRLS
jgi:FkbM family methyltransferase